MNTDDSRFTVKIETVEASNIKSIFGILKDNNIVEANIKITPDGLEILEMDPHHIVIAHVLLNASNFDSFYCKEPVKIGIDCVNLNKILKNVGAKDILTLFVEDPKDSNMGGDSDSGMSFGLLIENVVKGQVNKYAIDTIDVNDQEMEIPDINYPYHIQMPANDLQSIVSSQKNLGGDVIKLLFCKDILQFYTKGDIGRLETTRSPTQKEETSMKIQKNELVVDNTNITEIYVKLEKLAEFTKCSCLSTIVTIHLHNDFPLFLEYDVGSLGFIRLGVSLHNKPEDW